MVTPTRFESIMSTERPRAPSSYGYSWLDCAQPKQAKSWISGPPILTDCLVEVQAGQGCRNLYVNNIANVPAVHADAGHNVWTCEAQYLREKKNPLYRGKAEVGKNPA